MNLIRLVSLLGLGSLCILGVAGMRFGAPGVAVSGSALNAAIGAWCLFRSQSYMFSRLCVWPIIVMIPIGLLYSPIVLSTFQVAGNVFLNVVWVVVDLCICHPALVPNMEARDGPR